VPYRPRRTAVPPSRGLPERLARLTLACMVENRALIGRQDELAAFEAACAAVRDGFGRCVLVTGEAGIGKSRLAAEALAQPGLTTYAGAARAAVAEPYDPIAQVLRQCLRQAPDMAEACGALAPYLAPLLPELGIVALDAGPATLIEAISRRSP